MEGKNKKESETKKEKRARLKKIENTVTEISIEVKTMTETLTIMVKQVEQMRSEIYETHGADPEPNRTLNDMSERTREDLVKLMRAATTPKYVERAKPDSHSRTRDRRGHLRQHQSKPDKPHHSGKTQRQEQVYSASGLL